ncbi:MULTISPECIES: hypothetical protein [Giesbergeria]|uniref:Uncharacterized protein n=1 Tax=Giesbergeria sinuosa TaxID=80883 RepID=A0ABV9QE24_9BURK
MATTYTDLATEAETYAKEWEKDFPPPPADGQSAEVDRLKAAQDEKYSRGWADLEDETGNSTSSSAQTSQIETKAIDPLPPEPAGTTPVSVPSSTAAKALEPLAQTGELSFVDAQAKAKADGKAAFTWNGRSFETGGTERGETATQPKSFGHAFAQARRSGLSAFEWHGKQYTTQTKEEAASGRKAPAPANTSTPTAAPKATAPAPVAALPTPTPASRPAMAAPVAAPALTASQPAAAPVAPKAQAQVAPAPMPSGLTYRQELQKSYDDWQAAKSANTNWYGGKAQGSPGRKEAETQAEQRYQELLRNPR